MTLKQTLENFKSGKISLEEAEREVRMFQMHALKEFAVLDTHRENRTGVPEVVLGESKSDEEIEALIKEFVSRRGRCIITRLARDRVKAFGKKIRKSITIETNEKAGVLVAKKKGYKTAKTDGRVAILCAGTSDIVRAEEARIIAQEMGCEVYTFYDVGVAGIHRLLPAIKKIIEADVDAVIAVAGMEGALPSVVAGLVSVPVIGLPISTGYGVGGKGEGALLAMLQSCSPGLAVVNIDNGFGAGVLAALVANRAARFRKVR